ncbi:MAG: hypothetical protein ACREDR_45150 [Blastocatellia bacterium]
MKKVIVRILLSTILAAATFEGIGMIKNAKLSDALLMPGYLTAWLFYPGGVHDGHHSANGWLVTGICGAVLFYALLWFAILSLLPFPRKKPKSA